MRDLCPSIIASTKPIGIGSKAFPGDGRFQEASKGGRDASCRRQDSQIRSLPERRSPKVRHENSLARCLEALPSGRPGPVTREK